MKKLLTIALLLAVAAPASALDRSPRKKKRDKKAKTETVVPAPVPEAEPVPVPEPEPAPAEEPVVNDMTLGFSPEQTDSLLAAWRERQRQDAFSEFFKQYILEDSTEVADSTPDSVYSRRLLDLASPIQFPYNSIVKGYINRYTNSRYGTISRILGMSQYYFPIIEEELLREGLPVELRALPIIESALSPTAVSPMGAVGLWQFMPTTGKSYGLEINSLVDERRDPYRATQAACRRADSAAGDRYRLLPALRRYGGADSFGDDRAQIHAGGRLLRTVLSGGDLLLENKSSSGCAGSRRGIARVADLRQRREPDRCAGRGRAGGGCARLGTSVAGMPHDPPGRRGLCRRVHRRDARRAAVVGVRRKDSLPLVPPLDLLPLLARSRSSEGWPLISARRVLNFGWRQFDKKTAR